MPQRLPGQGCAHEEVSGVGGAVRATRGVGVMNHLPFERGNATDAWGASASRPCGAGAAREAADRHHHHHAGGCGSGAAGVVATRDGGAVATAAGVVGVAAEDPVACHGIHHHAPFPYLCPCHRRHHGPARAPFHVPGRAHAS